MNVGAQRTLALSWLLLIHQIPAKPAYLRVKIWRRLQGIGAVAVKNAVHALPMGEGTQEDFEWLLRESLYYPPIDPQSGELVWLYRVRENRVAIDFAESAGAPRSYVAFASGHIGYRADAQFDLARWNYSNYALQR